MFIYKIDHVKQLTKSAAVNIVNGYVPPLENNYKSRVCARKREIVYVPVGHPRIPRGDSASYIDPWDIELIFLRSTA